MLISIEFDRTCDLPGMGSGPPTPSIWICTCMTFKDLRIKSKGEESAAREEGNKISHFKVTGKPIYRQTKRIKNEICIPRMHL